MPIVLKNADVAARYETDFEKDQIIHVPGGRNGDGWKGPLSSIPLHAADKLYAQKHNALRLKKAVIADVVKKEKDSSK